MVYVSNGQVLDNRAQSSWNLSLLVDLVWEVVEFIGLFFKTIFNPYLSKSGSSVSSRFTDSRGPPGPPGGGRRMGRINYAAGPSPPPAGGG